MAKSIKNAIIIFIVAVSALLIFPSTVQAKEFEPRLTAPHNNKYYTTLNVYWQTGYGMPNCTAYAYGRVYEITGKKPLIDRGNAGEWWGINKANGYYEYGSEPKIGAIACWNHHVAVVEKITDTTVTVSESAWRASYFNTNTMNYDGSNSIPQTFYGYIYVYEEEKSSVNYKMQPNHESTFNSNNFSVYRSFESIESKFELKNPRALI